MQETGSERIPEKSGWSALATITTFDRGKTTPQKWKTKNALVPKKRTAINPPSLFVESLVEQLCKLFGKDPGQQNKLYMLICEKLYDLKLIDKTYKIKEFQFIRSSYQRALFQLLTVSKSPALESKLELYLNQSPSRLALPFSNTSYIYEASRYQNDFEEVKFIDQGGFGRVFHVRNKVDSCEYAIKKILLRCRDEDQLTQSLREVKTLANLDHCNIVAYKAAWFEPINEMAPEEDWSESSSPEVSREADPSELESSIPETEAEDDSGHIVFDHMNENVPENLKSTKLSIQTVKKETSHHLTISDQHYNYKSEAPGVLNINEVKTLNYSVLNRRLCDHISGSGIKGCRGRKVGGTLNHMEFAVLHIQMQLCKESLRDWLDKRNDALKAEFDSNNSTKDQPNHNLIPHLDRSFMSTALQIFMGILNGLEYMHSKDIVHHDLKPSNIFVDGFSHRPSDSETEEGDATGGIGIEIPLFEGKRYGRQVRVGDFGLACHLAHPLGTAGGENHDSGISKENAVTALPTNLIGAGNCIFQKRNVSKEENSKEIVGTKLYAAPEQMKGSCNRKSDVWSLGIILLELLYPFSTAMERGKVILALRSDGSIPADLEGRLPNLARLIRDMLSQNPAQRPSVKEIVEERSLIAISDDFRKLLIGNGGCYQDDKDLALTKIKRTYSSTQTSCGYQYRELHTKSHTTETISIKESEVIHSSCSISCHEMREQQEDEIIKLKEENLQKDETIRQLLSQIHQLQIRGDDFRENLLQQTPEDLAKDAL